MENASPSPPNTNTCRSGRVSEMPLANGSARPWMKCAPCACTKYGNRLEQPMPATVVIFSCHILRFSISLKYSASTEKSPQPGHHVGWSAAISFLVRPLRSPLADCVGALTTAMLPALRSGISVVRVLMVVWTIEIKNNWRHQCGLDWHACQLGLSVL